MGSTPAPPVRTLSRAGGLAAAPAPAAPIAGVEAYFGEGLSARFDGRDIIIKMPFGVYVLSPQAASALESFIATTRPKAWSAEADVWHEETKSHYRAVLVRKLTLDEIYQGLK